MTSNKKTFNNKGNDYLDLVSDKLNIDDISESVKHPECGAVSLFIGTTRNNFNDLKVVSLHYEAYKSMAIKVMKDICNNLRETWPDIVNIAIYHRLGDVPVCEASVVIAISSPHRQTSLSSVEHAINKLKELVPIWKKEEYENSGKESEWKENTESHHQDVEVTSTPLDSSMIQINNSHEEVFDNIKAFVKYRQNLNNKDNIQTYCKRNPEYKPEYSCSRVDAVGHRHIATKSEQQYVKEKEIFDDNASKKNKMDSKSHLKKRKEDSSKAMIRCTKQDSILHEDAGDTNIYLLEESKNSVDINKDTNIPFGVRERLILVENHINIKPDPNLDVYARMKLIEDRIMRIEDNCLQYIREKNYFSKENLVGATLQSSKLGKQNTESTKIKVFSIEEIDAKIFELKSALSKSNCESSNSDDEHT